MWPHIQYDENLTENPLFKVILQENHIITSAIEKSWVICVPRIGNLEASQVNEDVISNHLLVPNSDNVSRYCTLNGKNVIIKDKQIIPQDSKGNGKVLSSSVKILFEETFYSSCKDAKSKYTVWCIDRPLFSHESESKSDVTARHLNDLHDCIDFLWSTFSGSKIFEQIQAIIENFLNEDDNEYCCESLQSQKDLLGSVYSQCLQVVLKNDTITESLHQDSKFLNDLQLAVETYTQNCLNKKIFLGISTNICERDARLNKIIQNSSELQLTDLGIPQSFSEDISYAKCELNKLNLYGTVLDKINCLRSTFGCLTNDNNNRRGEYVSTDMLLQMFIYLILKLRVNNWVANLFFIKNFQFNTFTISTSNDEYLISTLEAAIEYIKSDSFMSLSVNYSGSNSSQLSPVKDLFNIVVQGDLIALVKMLNNPPKQSSALPLRNLCHPLCTCSKCSEYLRKSLANPEVSLSVRNDKKQSLLHLASLYSRCDIVDYLIHKKVKVDLRDIFGKTALHYSASRGSQDVLLLLINSNADLNCKDNNGNTALILACNNGHENCVKALVYSMTGMGVDANAVNNYGDTALHLAVKWGYMGIVQILLDNGAMVRKVNKRQQLPLDLTQNYYIAKLLEQYSLFESDRKYLNIELTKESRSLNSTESVDYGNQPSNPESRKKIDLLLKAIQNNDRPLTCFYLGFCSMSKVDHYEIERKCHPLCKCDKCFVLEKDFEIISIQKSTRYINVNFCDSHGYTPLHIAAQYGRSEILRLLLDSGALPNLRTYKERYTPLHLACIYQRLQVVKELVSARGCDVDAVDWSGNTPLYYSCMKNDSRLVEVLLQNGADCHVKNKSGTSLYQEVQDNMLYGIFKLLKESGGGRSRDVYEEEEDLEIII